MPKVVEVKARGNVPSQAAYSFGARDVELHFARLTVPHKSLEMTGMVELRGPKYGENCEKSFPALGYAAGAEPGHPKELAFAHPLECENASVGCQVRHYLLVSAPILDWSIHCHMTIERLAVDGNAGGVAMMDDSNPRGRAASVFLTRKRSVASVAREESMVVVDRANVKRR